MVIPELVAGEYLHDSNSPLDQSPGNKAPRAVTGRGGIIGHKRLDTAGTGLGRMGWKAHQERSS